VGSREFDVVVIGGGVSGLWTALDLVLRGLRVVLLERGVIGGGTSGKFHGLLHSGARYATTDPEAAVECISENRILTRIAPFAVEDTGGYFVAVTREDEEYYDELVESLKKTGIPHRELDVKEALESEPELSRSIRGVIEVPDRVVYARDLLVSIALTAFKKGALIVEGLEAMSISEGDEGLVVRALDKLKGGSIEIRASAVVNAAGPWAGVVAERAGIRVEVMPTAGTMVVYARRLTRRVLNRMRPPSDGDILVPYGQASIMGTTAFIVDDPDNVVVDEEDVEFLTQEGAAMVPALAKTPVLRAYASVRPLIRVEGEDTRRATRGFRVVEHEKPRGMFTIIGGKFTTGRLVGEATSDAVSEFLGVKKQSKTAQTILDGANPYEELKELIEDAGFALSILSLSGSIDEERGRPAAYTLIQWIISRSSRRRLGL
jgi:glycerol-3-phosphate dehydrogenase